MYENGANESMEDVKGFLEDEQHMQHQTPFLEASKSQEWPDDEQGPTSTGQPPTKSPLKQKSKKKENIRYIQLGLFFWQENKKSPSISRIS